MKHDTEVDCELRDASDPLSWLSTYLRARGFDGDDDARRQFLLSVLAKASGDGRWPALTVELVVDTFLEVESAPFDVALGRLREAAESRPASRQPAQVIDLAAFRRARTKEPN